MTRTANSYSRFVAWVKIILPLGALALMSSLVLFSRSIDPDAAIPLADVDVLELAREQMISAPTYSGMTSDGAAILLSAARARPDLTRPGAGQARDLTARIDTPDGLRVDVTARTGSIDTQGNRADLDGAVTMVTSNGYTLYTESVRTTLDRTDIVTRAPVRGLGPLGLITAGRAQLRESKTAPGTYVLVFQDGVKLVYEPRQ